MVWDGWDGLELAGVGRGDWNRLEICWDGVGWCGIVWDGWEGLE